MFRGKYGTAFRAPTLSDLFQGESGYYSTVVDYTQCAALGFGPDAVDDCPSAASERQFFGTQSGNVDLKPINADVWSAGFVWSPVDRMALTVDYFNWDIDDEVTQQSANGLTLQELSCRSGVDDINSPLCQQIPVADHPQHPGQHHRHLHAEDQRLEPGSWKPSPLRSTTATTSVPGAI